MNNIKSLKNAELITLLEKNGMTEISKIVQEKQWDGQKLLEISEVELRFLIRDPILRKLISEGIEKLKSSSPVVPRKPHVPKKPQTNSMSNIQKSIDFSKLETETRPNSTQKVLNPKLPPILPKPKNKEQGTIKDHNDSTEYLNITPLKQNGAHFHKMNLVIENLQSEIFLKSQQSVLDNRNIEETNQKTFIRNTLAEEKTKPSTENKVKESASKKIRIPIYSNQLHDNITNSQMSPKTTYEESEQLYEEVNENVLSDANLFLGMNLPNLPKRVLSPFNTLNKTQNHHQERGAVNVSHTQTVDHKNIDKPSVVRRPLPAVPKEEIIEKNKLRGPLPIPKDEINTQTEYLDFDKLDIFLNIQQWKQKNEGFLPRPPVNCYPLQLPELFFHIKEEYYDMAAFDLQNEPFYREVNLKGSKRLLHDLEDGAFLFRPSTKFFVTLTVKHTVKYFNLGIKRIENRKLICDAYENEGPEFCSLKNFVRYFKKNPLIIKYYEEFEIYLKPVLPENRF